MDARRLKGGLACSFHRVLGLVLAAVILGTLYLFTTRGPPVPGKQTVFLADWIRRERQDLESLHPVPEIGIEEIQKVIEARRPYVPPKRSPYNFEGFNNETGLSEERGFLVPNFVHFLRFETIEFDFLDFITVLAALRHQRPDRLFFHTNVERFKGDYWKKLLLTPGFADIVEIVHVDLPKEIFGQPLDNGYRVWHAGDITRIRILMKYGGIFLDNDSYMVQNLDKFRHFEIAMGWDEDQFIGTQVIVAHPDARFLREWLETYRGAYDKNKWYYNAGERPTKEVLFKTPEHIHRVKLLFGVHYLIDELYKERKIWPEWRDQYCIHLLKRHQNKKFDETNFKQPPTTIRDMILDVYDPQSGMARLI